MHGSGGVDDVEGLKAFLPTQPRQECLGERILESYGPHALLELQHPRDDELAQPAVGVVEQPVVLSRVAA
jgi:hypothetical protein